MAQGLQIWDNSGNLTFDTSLDTCEYLGEFNTTKTAGSFTVSYKNHENIWIMVSSQSTDGKYGINYTPRFSISGNVISWSFVNSDISYRAECTVIYGSYGG